MVYFDITLVIDEVCSPKAIIEAKIGISHFSEQLLFFTVLMNGFYNLELCK